MSIYTRQLLNRVSNLEIEIAQIKEQQQRVLNEAEEDTVEHALQELSNLSDIAILFKRDEVGNLAKRFCRFYDREGNAYYSSGSDLVSLLKDAYLVMKEAQQNGREF